MLPSKISDALPQGHGFLRNYVDYASQCSDAPEIYHVGVGLTVFASAVAKKLSAPWMAGRRLVPNLYTLLVGPSRSARKTGAMDIGIEILNGVQNELVIPIPGSYEELVTQIRATPNGLLTYREFGHFLKTTVRGYGEPIRTVLMDLYDWPPDRVYTRNLKKAKTIIEPPICLSMLSAIATDLLFSYSDTEEWTGGFFSRMLLLYGEREGWRMPSEWPAARDYLISQLYQYASYPFPPCGGFDPQAWIELDKWARWRDSRAEDAPDRMQSHIAGAQTLAAKVALLFAADAGEVQAGAGWLISLESVRRAILLVENLYLPSVYQLGEKLRIGIWEKDRGRVLDMIERARDVGISHRDLIRRVRMESKFMLMIIDTLREEGSIVQAAGDSRGIVYRRVDPTSGAGGRLVLLPGGQNAPAAGTTGAAP